MASSPSLVTGVGNTRTVMLVSENEGGGDGRLSLHAAVCSYIEEVK